MAARAEASERRALLRWYGGAARALPWRQTRDPYAIWVSEVMLQQTRVETVIPYYERFLARFPDVTVLSAASEDEVLSAWSGLGYYRRARLLHRGVREVVEQYGGVVPREREARLALPGIGRYTAGAIGSIAFDLPEPIVDGNVARVLSRLRGIEAPLGSATSNTQLWQEAERLVQGADPGALNQALMELGATVCTPTSPRCDACPIARGCDARRTDRIGELPRRAAKREPKRVKWVAVIAQSEQGLWVVRGSAGLYGGLWGVPMVEGGDARAVRTLMRAAGARAGRVRRVGELEHTLTHRVLQLRVYQLEGESWNAEAKPRRVRVDELAQLGTSTLNRKILALRA